MYIYISLSLSHIPNMNRSNTEPTGLDIFNRGLQRTRFGTFHHHRATYAGVVSKMAAAGYSWGAIGSDVSAEWQRMVMMMMMMIPSPPHHRTHDQFMWNLLNGQSAAVSGHLRSPEASRAVGLGE